MPGKNVRKLTRIGKISLAVIIPPSWLRYYNLKYGDSVEVITNGSGSIEIKTLKKTPNMEE